MSLIFPPIYIKLLGIEAYGLIGFFTTMQILFGIFDGGITTSMHRQISELTISNNNTKEIRNIIRTTEIIYWAIGLFIGLIIYFIAPYIAEGWLVSNKLSIQSIESVLIMSGLVILAQWPSIVYKQCLMALKKQVSANVIYSIFISLRGILAVIVLLTISKSIYALFLCFFIAEIIKTIVLMIFVWKSIPGESAYFDVKILSREWKFSSRLMIISAISLLASQIDKIILSKIISLEYFGYYTLSSFVAFSIYRIFSPLVAGINPDLIQFVKKNNINSLIKFYHKSCQLVSVLLFPLCTTIALFSFEILYIWTQNKELAASSYLVCTFLVISAAFNALLHVPYKLQLANKWTGLALYINIIGALFLFPSIYFAAIKYNIDVVGATYMVYHFIVLLIATHFMHQRLIKTEKWKWIVMDVIVPLLVSLIIIGLGRYFISYNNNHQILFVIYVLSLYLLSSLTTIMVMPSMRRMLFNLLSKKKLKPI